MAEDHIDYLDEDTPIAGQNYCCASFITPEAVLKDKHLFFINEYLRDLSADKHNKENENFREKTDLQELVKQGKLNYEGVKESYDAFLFREQNALEAIFHEMNDFKTTIAGFKVRGTYDTIVEAKARAARLQKKDPLHNVYVMPIGKWTPYMVNPDQVEDQEYQESQLNTLMKKYRENREDRDTFYEQEKEQRIKDAIKRNKEKQAADALAKQATQEAALPTVSSPFVEQPEEKKEEGIVHAPVEPVEPAVVEQVAPTPEQNEAVVEKINVFRELLNKKDGVYDDLMDSKRSGASDPWMERKGKPSPQ